MTEKDAKQFLAKSFLYLLHATRCLKQRSQAYLWIDSLWYRPTLKEICSTYDLLYEKPDFNWVSPSKELFLDIGCISDSLNLFCVEQECISVNLSYKVVINSLTSCPLVSDVPYLSSCPVLFPSSPFNYSKTLSGYSSVNTCQHNSITS